MCKKCIFLELTVDAVTASLVRLGELLPNCWQNFCCRILCTNTVTAQVGFHSVARFSDMFTEHRRRDTVTKIQFINFHHFYQRFIVGKKSERPKDKLRTPSDIPWIWFPWTSFSLNIPSTSHTLWHILIHDHSAWIHRLPKFLARWGAESRWFMSAEYPRAYVHIRLPSKIFKKRMAVILWL